MNSKQQPEIESRRIVGLIQAAKYAGVSRFTLVNWINSGELPVIRYPGRNEYKPLRGAKVDLDDLDRLIERAKDPKKLQRTVLFKS